MYLDDVMRAGLKVQSLLASSRPTAVFTYSLNYRRVNGYDER